MAVVVRWSELAFSSRAPPLRPPPSHCCWMRTSCSVARAAGRRLHASTRCVPADPSAHPLMPSLPHGAVVAFNRRSKVSTCCWVLPFVWCEPFEPSSGCGARDARCSPAMPPGRTAAALAPRAPFAPNSRSIPAWTPSCWMREFPRLHVRDNLNMTLESGPYRADQP